MLQDGNPYSERRESSPSLHVPCLPLSHWLATVPCLPNRVPRDGINRGGKARKGTETVMEMAPHVESWQMVKLVSLVGQALDQS